ncbi:hypothetical protein [Phenylobacterium sp.]|jgi:hypothetical protein|uniref:hypothetical protein n=1 Tax=Phenylobacterium sp. TaxID=1871053 RepID=UPI0037837041
MRSMICAAAVLALASPAFAAEPKPAVKAASAEQFAKPASERGPMMAHGYSEQARRIADCLATYPGYDPKLDRVVVRPGVVRRCQL